MRGNFQFFIISSCQYQYIQICSRKYIQFAMGTVQIFNGVLHTDKKVFNINTILMLIF